MWIDLGPVRVLERVVLPMKSRKYLVEDLVPAQEREPLTIHRKWMAKDWVPVAVEVVPPRKSRLQQTLMMVPRRRAWDSNRYPWKWVKDPDRVLDLKLMVLPVQ